MTVVNRKWLVAICYPLPLPLHKQQTQSLPSVQSAHTATQRPTVARLLDRGRR